MIRQLRPAVALLILFTLLLGTVYPLAMTGIAQGMMPHQANGSLIVENGRVVGSELIGQSFSRPGYFHGRPSAAGNGYDPLNSSGSNLGPASKALIDRTKASVAAARTDGASGPLPPDMVTASGSGLDPHISPEAAYLQVARVARARGVDPGFVHALVERHVETPLLPFLGDPVVNVLALNRQLDRIGAKPAR
ncbi:MAG TPA: potassium-transporting ATPase subunit KdpC [Allosphingosinicella sp.]|jgi:K+-transporting ATPase ATPase C chain|nr:potassium-transporting ATPase subunit KdpC [Allosphingosinicella sp.]